MKIKIIKCSNSSWWYNKHIGLVVDVDTDNFYELSKPRSITANENYKHLSAASSPIICSTPAYKSSVFSLTITRSIFSYLDLTPSSETIGRTFAYKSSYLRSCTFTLLNPSPIGVVREPLYFSG